MNSIPLEQIAQFLVELHNKNYKKARTILRLQETCNVHSNVPNEKSIPIILLVYHNHYKT